MDPYLVIYLVAKTGFDTAEEGSSKPIGYQPPGPKRAELNQLRLSRLCVSLRLRSQLSNLRREVLGRPQRRLIEIRKSLEKRESCNFDLSQRQNHRFHRERT